MKYIAYLRCSTKEQGKSGLGFHAQREQIMRFVESQPQGELINAYIDVHSGKDNKRAKLLAALAECKRTGATLVLSKLDRLSRSVAYIATLIEQGYRFKCADCPNDDTTMLHFRAVIAEDERRKISQRTKDALAHCTKPIGYAAPNHGLKLRRMARLEAYRPKIEALRASGANTIKAIAAGLGLGQTVTARMLREIGSGPIFSSSLVGSAAPRETV